MKRTLAILALLSIASLSAMAAWSPVGSLEGFDGIELFLPGVDLLYAGSTAGFVYGSVDHGGSWETIGNGLEQEYAPVVGLVVDGDWILMGRSVGPVFNYYCHREETSWGTWTPLPYQNDPISSFAVIGEDLFAVLDGVVHRSADHGFSWTPVTGPTEERIHEVFAYEGRLFASRNIVNGGAIYRSDDLGVTWTVISATLGSSYICAHTFFEGELCISVYHGGANGTLWRSPDHGDSWTQVTGLPTSYNLNGLAVAGSRLAIGASSGYPNGESVWLSEDFASWEDYTDDLPQSSWPVNAIVSHDGWFFKTGGTVQTYRSPHPEIPASIADGGSLMPLGELRIHPNPYRPGTRIDYRLPQPGIVDLSIHDVQGRIVKTLFRGTGEAGDHTVAWDGTDALGRPAPAGVYLVRLRSDRISLTKKLLRAE